MHTENEEKRGYKIKKYTLLLLGFLWIVSMAVFGFMLPHFIDNLSFFKASKIVIYKNKYIPSDKVKDTLAQLNWNWLFTREGTVRNLLTKKMGNIIEDVEINREITREGIVLKIKVYEREPVAIVKENSNIYLIDKEGKILPYVSPKGKYTIIYTDDINKITSNFSYLYKNIISKLDIREAYITDNKVVLYMKDNNIKLLLPSIETMGRSIVKNLEKVLFIINSEGIGNAIIDLRFSKFASIKMLSVAEDL